MAEIKAKEARRRAGLSREEVAAHFGVSWQTIRNWEIVDGALRLETAIEMCCLYQVTLDQLAGLAPLNPRKSSEIRYSLTSLSDDEAEKVAAYADHIKAER